MAECSTVICAVPLALYGGTTGFWLAGRRWKGCAPLHTHIEQSPQHIIIIHSLLLLGGFPTPSVGLAPTRDPAATLSYSCKLKPANPTLLVLICTRITSIDPRMIQLPNRSQSW